MARPLGRISSWQLAAALAALAIMAFALALAAAPAQARASELAASNVMADSGAVEYEYYEEPDGWKTGTLNSGDYEVVKPDTDWLNDGWYVVSGDVAVNDCLEVHGDARLVLCGGAELDAQKGIRVPAGSLDGPAGSSLSVYAGRSSGGTAGGTLLATGDFASAGIGSNANEDAGSVAIHGGTVYAQGGDNAAGIGGGNGGNGGPVTVYGGTVYAQGDDGAAGIGGGIGIGNGNTGNGGPVTVYGGTVYAQGDGLAAGIGGGKYGRGGDVAIYGGAVTGISEGCEDAAGIGRGSYGRSDGALTLGPGVSVYCKYSLEDPWGEPCDPYDGNRTPVMSTDSTTVCEVTATFHSRGICVDPQAQEVRRLGRFSEPDPEPSAEGYTFAGWYADEGCTAPFDFGERALGDADVWAKWAPELGFGAPSVSKTYGDAGFANPLENPSGVQVSYASSDPGVAAVGSDGVVAIKGAGECVVTASFAGAPGLSAASASYTLTVARKVIAVPKAKAGLVYSGKAQIGVAAGEGYTVKGGSATNAGSYTATLTADANHAFSDGAATATVNWSIAKAANPLKLAKASRSAKLSKAKKAKGQTVAGAKVSAKGQGAVTYSIAKVVMGKKKVKGFKKNFAVNKKTGKITLKGLAKKGTYKVTVQAVAAGNANYKKSAAKTAVVTIKVK